MKIDAWLRAAEARLKAAGISTSRLDALVLLEDGLNKSRTHLLAHPEIELSAPQIELLNRQIDRRSKHEPLAYIRGKTEFYGREFIVGRQVLEPRPESETMIELLLKQSLPAKPQVADIGTGSGALGITTKLELPNADVDLIELDKDAIKIAQKNVIKYTTSISVIRSNLLESTTKNYDVLLCNLPYVPDDFQINLAATQEPSLAIFGGKDGLDIYRKLFGQIAERKIKPLLILCESMPPQQYKLSNIAGEAGYSVVETEDFIQVFKRVD